MPNPQIIYEDANVLVINKPAGLKVHGDGINQVETLVDWLVERYPDDEKVGLALRSFSEVGEDILSQKGKVIKKPGLVHRLDKDTSGVMIVAKNQPTFLFLKKQFQNRETKKVYRAILSGGLKLAPGEEKIINLPIGRSRNDPRKRVASKNADGLVREAVTIFRLIENLGDKYAYVEAEPKTGRTHQVRVHAQAFSHPIIGDHLYNPNDNGGGAIGRQALHSYQLTIKLPPNQEMIFEAPLTSDFTQALEKLKASC